MHKPLVARSAREIEPARVEKRRRQRLAFEREAERGTDFHHDVADYLPVVGHEIVRALLEQGAHGESLGGGGRGIQ